MSPIEVPPQNPEALTNLFMLALCCWREMRGATVDERRGCCWVIMNRAQDPGKRWPRTVPGVIAQRYQFSSFMPGDPNAIKWPMNDGSGDWKAWCEIVEMLPDGLGTDPTLGANSYENMPASKQKPGWADAARITKVIGDTRFYKL